MPTNDPNSSAPEPAPAEVRPRESMPMMARRPGRRLRTLAVTAGLAAGVLTWAVGETGAVVARPVQRPVNFMGSGVLVPSTTPEARQEVVRQTSMRAFGLLGCLTGLLLGCAGGASAGSPRRAATAGGVAAVVGGLLGALVPWVTLPWFVRWRVAGGEALLPSLLMHATFWVPIGAAGGLALGLGDRNRAVDGAAGGALGAVLATLAYELLGALAFPLAKTGEPISATWPTRLLAYVLVTSLVATGAALLITRTDPTPKVGA